MDDKPEVILDPEMKGVSRRAFIKGVIAGGVATSSAALGTMSSIFGRSNLEPCASYMRPARMAACIWP